MKSVHGNACFRHPLRLLDFLRSLKPLHLVWEAQRRWWGWCHCFSEHWFLRLSKMALSPEMPSPPVFTKKNPGHSIHTVYLNVYVYNYIIILYIYPLNAFSQGLARSCLLSLVPGLNGRLRMSSALLLSYQPWIGHIGCVAELCWVGPAHAVRLSWYLWFWGFRVWSLELVGLYLLVGNSLFSQIDLAMAP